MGGNSPGGGSSGSGADNPFEAARPTYARVRPAYPAAAVAAIVRAAGLGVRGSADGSGSRRGDAGPTAQGGAGGSARQESATGPTARGSAGAPASTAATAPADRPVRGLAADIGAGTGKMSALLAGEGLEVRAVEPSAAMRAQARPHPLITQVAATAEDTGLGAASCDLVVYAQSWHWVDPVAAGAEAVRILKPGAPLVIVFNQMDVSVQWVHRLSRIMRSGDVHRADRPPRPAGFAPPALERFWWEDRMEPEQILELGTTRSSYLRADAARRRAMQDNLRWYLYEHLGHRAGQEITIPYSTLVWTTRAPAARVP